jgi:hypothetical protein
LFYRQYHLDDKVAKENKMQTSAVVHPFSLTLPDNIAFNLARFALLSILFFAVFVFGSGPVVPYLPLIPAEPGCCIPQKNRIAKG